MAFTDTFRMANGWIWGTSDLSGAQSDEELVAAPGAGSYIEIAALFASKEAAGQVQFEDQDDNQIVNFDMAATSTEKFVVPLEILDAVGGIKLAANKALDVTSAGASGLFVGAIYRIVTR